jgi:hypothetical protein
VLFDHKLYPSVERLINSDSTVTRVWNPIALRNLEDGDDTFSKTSVQTGATQYKVPEGIYGMFRGSGFDTQIKLCLYEVCLTSMLASFCLSL